MIFAALSEAAEKGELLIVADGLCRWHKRRDGVVVIREIIVLPFRRRTGVGKRLVEEVIRRSFGRAIQAKCPVKYAESQLFWQAMGFTRMEEKNGIVLWQRPANP